MADLIKNYFQMPIFISFFVGLRRMANAPVESFHTGGMLWFTDLTVCDPYYILPVITSVTLWATVEVSQMSENFTFSLYKM
jgi:YidC/Oxa1 family membrane protein insertase